MTSLDQAPQGPVAPGPAGPQPQQDPFRHLDAQGPESDPFRHLEAVGQRWAEEAQGVGEHLYWQGAAAAKSAADSVTHAATTIVKGLNSAVSFAKGDGFGQGWREIGESLKHTTGQSDPGVFELWEGIGRTIGVGDDQIDVGRGSDTLIDKRLGRSRALGDSIGALLTFVETPTIAAGGARLAKPLANMIERGAARAAGKLSGVENVGDLLRRGTVWDVMAKGNEQWRQTAGWLAKTSAGVGRRAQDYVGTAAGNVAQSVLMTTDEQREHALYGALIASPFLIPISRFGEMLGNKVLTSSIGQGRAGAVREAFEQFESGRLTAPEFDKIVQANTSRMARGAAIGLSGALEGTAFFGLQSATDRDVWDMWKRSQAGDADATAQLWWTMLGSAAGVVGAKTFGHGGYAPMFRSLRPETNRLDTWIEAEANRQFGLEFERGQQAADRFETPKAPADETVLAERLGQDPDESVRQRILAEHRAKFAWAEPLSGAMLRGGWEPALRQPDGSVEFVYGPDRVRVQRDQDGPTVTPDAAVVEALRSFDLPHEFEGGVATGRQALELLDNLALISTFRRLQGSFLYERLGLQQADSDPTLYVGQDTIYRMMRLDGRTATRGGYDRGWTGHEDVAAAGLPHEVGWHSPALDAAQAWLTTKRVQRPDPLVDGILGNALALAQYGRGPSSEALRQFLTVTPPDQLVAHLTAGNDRMAALQIGGLGSGIGNPESVAREIAADQVVRGQGERAAAMSAPPDRAEHLAAMQGEPIGDPAVAARNRETEAETAAAESERQQREQYLGAMREGVHEIPAPHQPDATGKLVDVTRPTPEQRREDLAAGVAAARIHGESRPVRVTAQQATTLLRFIARGSKLGKRLVAIEESGGVGQAAFPAADFQRLMDYWSRRSSQQAPPDADPAFAKERLRLAQSADTVLQAVADSFGVRPKDRGELLTERTAKLQSAPDEAATGAMGGQELARVAKGVGRVARAAHDPVFEAQADVLTKALPNDKLAWNARRADAKAQETTGRAREAFRLAERALNTREGKRLTRQHVARQTADSKRQGTEPAWVELVDKTRAATTPTERAIQEGAQAGIEVTWAESSRVGTMRPESTPDGPQWQQLARKRSRYLLQRVPREGMREVMDNADLREKWWTDNLKLNEGDPSLVVTENGQTRRLTAADLEAEWQAKLEKLPDSKSYDQEAATEIHRRFQRTYYDWKPEDGKVRAMYESSPTEAFRVSSRRQAARASAIEVYGQDIPADARAALAARTDLSREARANLDRGGVRRALEETAKSIAATRDTTDRARLLRYASDLVARIQGTEPVESWRLTEKLRDFTSTTSGFMSSTAGVMDLPEPFFRMPWLFGFTRMAKALAYNIRHPIEIVRRAEMLGSIEHQMGDYVVAEASHAGTKLANIAGWVSSKLERWKGAVANKAAELIIADARAGRIDTNQLQLAQDLLRLSADDVMAIREGRISPELETQWRRELVALGTSRVSAAGGSSFSANPNARANVRFIRFATKRMADHMRMFASLKRAVDRDGWNSKGALVALGRVAGYSASSMLVGGSVAMMLGQALRGLFAGKPWDEGIKRYWDEMVAEPGRSARDAFLQQALGGPFQQLVRAVVTEPDSGRAWANLTVPTAVALGVSKATYALATGDSSGVWRGLSGMGVLPATAHLEHLQAALTNSGKLAQSRLDKQFVDDFLRDNGIKRPSGQRNKPDAFYDAIDQIHQIAKDGTDARQVFDLSVEKIRAAMDLAPKDSVAASIEGQQMVRDLNNEQRQALAERTDEKRMDRIYQHDAMLKDLAGLVRRIEGAGTYTNQWESEVEAVREQAFLGARDRWGTLIDRALAETAQRVSNRETFGTQVDDVAEAFAMFPEHMSEPMFTRAQLRALQDHRIDHLTRARRVAAILRSRVHERAHSITRDRAEARRAGQR